MSQNQATWVKATEDQINDIRHENDFVEGAVYYVTSSTLKELQATTIDTTEAAMKEAIQAMLSESMPVIISEEAMDELKSAISTTVHDTIAYHEDAEISTFYEDSSVTKGYATREALEQRGIPIEDGPGGVG